LHSKSAADDFFDAQGLDFNTDILTTFDTLLVSLVVSLLVWLLYRRSKLLGCLGVLAAVPLAAQFKVSPTTALLAWFYVMNAVGILSFSGLTYINHDSSYKRESRDCEYHVSASCWLCRRCQKTQ
jgi:hypothetical protein